MTHTRSHVRYFRAGSSVALLMTLSGACSVMDEPVMLHTDDPSLVEPLRAAVRFYQQRGFFVLNVEDGAPVRFGMVPKPGIAMSRRGIEIVLSEDEDWAWIGEACTDAFVVEDAIRHEIGHQLGRAHVEGDPGDVMYPRARPCTVRSVLSTPRN